MMTGWPDQAKGIPGSPGKYLINGSDHSSRSQIGHLFLVGRDVGVDIDVAAAILAQSGKKRKIGFAVNSPDLLAFRRTGSDDF